MSKNTLHFICSVVIFSAILFAQLITGVIAIASVLKNLLHLHQVLLNSLFSL